MSVFRVFLARIFPQLNAGTYGPEKRQTRTLFKKCLWSIINNKSQARCHRKQVTKVQLKKGGWHVWCSRFVANFIVQSLGNAFLLTTSTAPGARKPKYQIIYSRFIMINFSVLMNIISRELVWFYFVQNLQEKINLIFHRAFEFIKKYYHAEKSRHDSSMLLYKDNWRIVFRLTG